MPKPTPVIKKALNTERKAEVWELKVKQGLSVRGIAELMGVSTSNIYTILRQIIMQAEKTLDNDVFRWKLEQHYKYDHIYQQSMEAWESSKGMKKRVRVKQGAVETLPHEITTNSEEQAGDSRFLNAAVAALQAQAKLWGFNAPDMLETTNRNLTVTANIRPEDAMDAVAAAERAFRERKFGNNGQQPVRAISAQSSVVVSGVREDQPSDAGTDTLRPLRLPVRLDERQEPAAGVFEGPPSWDEPDNSG